MSVLLDIYLRCDGDLRTVSQMTEGDEPELDLMSAQYVLPTLAAMHASSAEAFDGAGWPLLLPAGVQFLYRLSCLCDLNRQDLLKVLSDDSDELLPTLADELPEDERRSGLERADGSALDAPESIGAALSFLLELGMLASESGRLIAVRPIPDPRALLNLSDSELDALERFCAQVRFSQQLERYLLHDVTVSLRELGDALGLNVDDAQQTLCTYAASSESAERLSALKADEEFRLDDFELQSPEPA